LPNKRVKTDALRVSAQWWGIGAPLTRPTLAIDLRVVKIPCAVFTLLGLVSIIYLSVCR